MELQQIGTDPEVFVQDELGNIISGIGLIGGSKAHPRLVKDGAVQEDNMLAEFNTNPASTADEFVGNIQSVVKQLSAHIAPKQLKVISSHRFTAAVIKAAGPKAMEFGCEPDFNAWTTDQNNPPDPTSTLRTAGGHVHLSFNSGGDKFAPYKVGAMLDFYLGLPSVIIDKDVERRSMYGQAGAIRPKPYGVEYRTLSNFWLKNEHLMRWVYSNSKLALERTNTILQLRRAYGDDIQEIINNSDVIGAQQIIEELSIPMPEEQYYG